MLFVTSCWMLRSLSSPLQGRRKIWKFGLWQYRLWSFMFGDTQSNRLLPESEVFQRIIWFLQNHHSLWKDTKISFEHIHLWQKILPILYLRTWNSITGIAILLTLQKLWHDDYCTSFDFCQQFWQISSRECCVHIRLWLNMVIRVVEFSREGYKIRKIFV